MNQNESLIQKAKTYPGYYGYRPVAQGEMMHLSELVYRLSNKEKTEDYTLILFCENGKVIEGIVDVRDTTTMIMEIYEEEEEYQAILAYKNHLMDQINQLH